MPSGEGRPERRSARVLLAILSAAGLVVLSGASVDGCNNITVVDPSNPRIGTSTCLQCHDGRTAPDQREFLRGPHAAIACEDCHGAGFAHFRAGGRGGLFIDNPGDDPFGAAAQLCARCHQAQVDGHAATAHGILQAASCITCHNVHKRGAMAFSTPNDTALDVDGFVRLCGDCHPVQTNQYAQSVHAQLGVATCSACHDLHGAGTLTADPVNNSLCQQCHASFQLGLDTEAAVDAHTGDFHPVDPAGSGASRCTSCHMPPLSQAGQAFGAHDHTLFTVAPEVSNADLLAGRTPRPNSCAGISGCHDAAVPGSGAPFDVNDPEDNDTLQGLYETIGIIP